MKGSIIAAILCLSLFFFGTLAAAADCTICSGNYTISATGNTGGTISPSRTVKVGAGTNQTFVMTPDPSELDCWGSGKFYVVWDYIVDGQTIPLPEPSRDPVVYTFTNVSSDHTIQAEFSYALVDARPRATFLANTTLGPTPLAVNFTQDQVSDNTGLLWTFGDGTNSTEPNPVHTFQSPGIYNVNLTIFCENLSFTGVPLAISAFGPPVADFTANQTSGFEPLAVQFTDTSTGFPPFTYTWDFGDGSLTHEQNPAHLFTDAGLNMVTLKVGNPAGNDSKTMPIEVIGPIGGNKGYVLVHCNVDDAKVYFDDDLKGFIEDGTLNVTLYLTAAPYHTYTVEKDGYQVFSASLPYPGKDQTVNLYVDLIPGPVLHVRLGEGWNLFSTPVALDSGHDTLLSIFDEEEQEKIPVVLGWNGIWFIPGPDYTIDPLDAFYINAEGSPRADLVPSSLVTVPPSRYLDTGLTLIGPAPAYGEGMFPAMPLDQALASINQTPGGTGYIMVVSPGLNQPGWAYARGMPVRDLEPFKGYWVVMEHPDTLYGFSTTPINI